MVTYEMYALTSVTAAPVSSAMQHSMHTVWKGILSMCTTNLLVAHKSMLAECLT
jgi:hypothetical protein